MEISSNSTSLKRQQATNSQFSLATETQDGSAFDLLLSLPIAPSPQLNNDPGDGRYSSDELHTPDCPACEYKSDSVTNREPESDSTEESQEPVEESAQSLTAASVASIDAIAVQQNNAIDAANTEVPQDTESHELPKVETAKIDGDVPVTPLANATAEPAAQEIGGQAEIAPKSETKPVNKDIQRGESVTQNPQVEDTDSVQLEQPKAIENDQLSHSNDVDLQAASPQTSLPAPQQAVVKTGTAQETTDSLPNTETPKATTATESPRRASNRERPDRWYERDRDQSSIDDAESLVQSTATDLERPIEATASVDLSDAGYQPGEQFTGQSESSEFSIASDAPPVTTSNYIDNPILATASANNSSTSESATRASTDTIRSVSSSAGGTQSRLTDGESPVESSQTGPQVDITRAEKARLVQRVARSFTRLGVTGGNLQLKLHPPELGALAVQVRIEGKSMSAKLTTESQAAREVIMESLPQLRSRLAEQGFDVVEFTVDVSSDSSASENRSDTAQTGAGQGQQGSDAENGRSGQQYSALSMRRANYLRRHLDGTTTSTQALVSNRMGRGVDIQA